MDTSLIITNLLSPPILFFFAGLLAVRLGSDLDIPSPLPKLFSFYLLLAIGFKGGVELSKSGLNSDVVMIMSAAVLLSIVVPIVAYLVLRHAFSTANAAAVAATYGSVSAVTFIAATALLTRLEISYSGYMVAALAIMESPAIIIAVILYRNASQEKNNGWRSLLSEAFLNGSVYLLIVSMIIGILTGDVGAKLLKPFTVDLFQGMLCMFLLDMGLVSSRRFDDLKKLGKTPILFASLTPPVNAVVGIGLAWLLGMSVGNALLFTVLAASASYIAVPAAMRMAIPEANPGVYVTMALAVTFPINVMIGLPVYLSVIQFLWR